MSDDSLWRKLVSFAYQKLVRYMLAHGFGGFWMLEVVEDAWMDARFVSRSGTSDE